MKVLKHLQITYLLESEASTTLQFLQTNSKNIKLEDNFENLFNHLNSQKSDILFIEKEVSTDTLKKLRDLNKSMQIVVFKNSLDLEDYYLAIELTNLLYIDFELNFEQFKQMINCLTKTIDSNKTNIEKLKDGFVYDSYNTTLLKDDKIVSLSRKENMFLEYIIDNKDRAVPYEEINKTLWNGEMTQNALRSVVKEVRKKTYKDLIKNISGTGYKANL